MEINTLIYRWFGRFFPSAARIAVLERDARIAVLERENKYLVDRIEGLNNILANSVSHVTIDIDDTVDIRPWNYLDIADIEVADGLYCSFSFDDWSGALSDLYNTLKPKQIYTRRVFDCDDFALMFSGMFAYSAYKSGFVSQPALAIAWSDIHAFCLFVTSIGRVYIYEPQDNRITAYEEAIKNPLYDVRKIWFMA